MILDKAVLIIYQRVNNELMTYLQWYFS